MNTNFERPRIIALGNQKGGVGKTTNTVHIAAALAEQGRRCLIFDLDMNHGATRHFGIPADAFQGTLEVLIGDENPRDVILTNGEEEIFLPKNLDLIPARRQLEQVDQALAARNKFIVTQDILQNPLQSLYGLYDYIFLDTAPNATTPTLAAYKAANWFVLSAVPDPFAIAGLGDALADIQAAQSHGNESLKLLGVVLSGVDRRTTLANTLTDYVEEIFMGDSGKSAKFETIISRSTVVPKCQEKGLTLFETQPTHKVTEQYRALAREIEARIEAIEGQPVSQPAEQVVQPERDVAGQVNEVEAVNG